LNFLILPHMQAANQGENYARDLKLTKALLKERKTGGRGQQQAVRGRLRV
jgi:hypothetical protein